MYQNMVVNLKQEVEDSIVNKLTLASKMVDMNMNELEQLAIKISYDPKLTKFMAERNGFSMMEAVEELSKYKASNDFADAVFLYFRGDDVIYSSDGLYQLNILINYVYKYKSWDRDQFYNEINNTEVPIIRPAEEINLGNKQNLRMLTYIYPMSPDKGSPYSTVMFLIRESMLNDIIYNILGEFEGTSYVFDDTNQVLAYKDNGHVISIDSASKLLSEYTNGGVYSVSLENHDYSFISVKSADTGWDFVTVIPTAQFFSKVIHVRTIVIFVLSILAMIGLSAAFAMAKNNYGPIKGMFEYVKLHRAQSSSLSNNDEISLISTFIEDTMRDSEQLVSRVNQQEILLKERFLNELLRGEIKEKELMGLKNGSKIEFAGSHMFVLLISLSGQNTSALDRDKAIRYLTMLSFGWCIGYGIELIHEDVIAVMFSLEDGMNDVKNQMTIAESIALYLEKNISIQPVIGIGNIYDDIVKMNLSYIEASLSLSYAQRDNNVNIMHFNDIALHSKQLYWYPEQDEMLFIQSLKQGNKNAALEKLDNIIDDIKRNNQSFYMCKHLYYDLVNIIIKAINEMNITELAGEVETLLACTSPQEFETKLSAITGEMCNCISRKRVSQNMELKNNILQFVGANFANPDISLENIADRFNISMSYLSRFFKSQTGYTFTEYLKMLRMEEVKKQLLTTDRPIKDIIADVGYIDISHFLRYFKSCEGLTPGEYRQLHKRNSEVV